MKKKMNIFFEKEVHLFRKRCKTCRGVSKSEGKEVYLLFENSKKDLKDPSPHKLN